jgi:O-antigen ligase
MKAASRTPTSSPLGRPLTAVLAVTLVAAPLFRAGQTPLALLGLELAALVLLVMALWRPPALTRGEIVAVTALALFPLVYLIPLPLGLVEALPGREAYLDVWRTAFGDDGLPASARLTLVPPATQAAWLVLLIPVGVFLAVRSLASRQLTLLVGVLLAVTAVQAVIGLMQFGAGRDSGLYFGMDFSHFDSAVGTYTNRNHLAGLIEMALPIALALLFFTAGRDRAGHRSLRSRAAFLGSGRGQEALVYAALVVLFLLAVTFSRSRMGIGMTMLGILLSVALFSRRIGGNNAYGPIGSLVAIALGLAVTIGLVPVLDRFSVEGVVEDGRWAMFDATLTGVATFFPVGSGPGTYGDIFPAFQPLELGRWFVNRAHNDYLEWVFEAGLPAVLLIGGMLVLYALRWRRVLVPGDWSRLRFIQAGAGIGIALILLHELVDYNLHIPANLVFFALLAGIFFSDAETLEAAAGPRRTRGTARMDEPEPETTYAPVAPPKPAPDQIKNPFLDD